MAEEHLRAGDPPPLPILAAAPTAVVPDQPSAAVAEPSAAPAVPTDLSLRLRAVHPGFWWCVAWCAAMLLVTQILPGIVGLILFVVWAAGDPKAVAVVNSPDLFRSPTYSQAMLVALSLAQGLSIGMVWLVLRLIVGKKWPRALHLYYPRGSHLALALIGLPALMFVSLGVGGLASAVFPNFFLDEAMSMVLTWPGLTAVLVIGVGPGIGEELWFRGFMGRGLVSRYGVVGGVALTSLLFGLVHLEPRQVVVAMVMGVFLHLSYLASRSLLIPMILHMANNSLSVLAPRNSILAVGELAPEQVSWQVYGASILLLAAVGWAFYKTRAPLADWPASVPTRAERPRRSVVAWLVVIAVGLLFLKSTVPVATAAAEDAEAERVKNKILAEALAGLNEIPAAPPTSWASFAAPDGSFQAAFPGSPVPQEKEERFEIGKVKRSAYSVAIPETKVSYGVDVIDVDPAVMKQLTEERCFHWVETRTARELTRGRAVQRGPTTVGGHSGRETWIRGATAVVIVRMCLVPAGEKTRLFVLTVRGDGVRPNAKDATRFFDSFTCS